MFTSNYFNLGKVVCTATLNNAMSENKQFASEVMSALQKYCNKDWGDLCEEDKAMNDYAMKHDNCRIVARYNHMNDVNDIYIMAWRENGKVQVEILFCSEY